MGAATSSADPEQAGAAVRTPPAADALFERLRGAYAGLERGDRRAALELVDTRLRLAYDGGRTVLYAVLALLHWLDGLAETTVAVEERPAAANRLAVAIHVRGYGPDSRLPVAFDVVHVWAFLPDGAVRFQWFELNGDPGDRRA